MSLKLTVEPFDKNILNDKDSDDLKQLIPRIVEKYGTFRKVSEVQLNRELLEELQAAVPGVEEDNAVAKTQKQSGKLVQSGHKLRQLIA